MDGNESARAAGALEETCGRLLGYEFTEGEDALNHETLISGVLPDILELKDIIQNNADSMASLAGAYLDAHKDAIADVPAKIKDTILKDVAASSGDTSATGVLTREIDRVYEKIFTTDVDNKMEAYEGIKKDVSELVEAVRGNPVMLEGRAEWEAIKDDCFRGIEGHLEDAVPRGLKERIAKTRDPDALFVYGRDAAGNEDTGIILPQLDLRVQDNGAITDRFGITLDGRVLGDVGSAGRTEDGIARFISAINEYTKSREGYDPIGNPGALINSDDVDSIRHAIRIHSDVENPYADSPQPPEQAAALEKYAAAVRDIYGVGLPDREEVGRTADAIFSADTEGEGWMPFEAGDAGAVAGSAAGGFMEAENASPKDPSAAGRTDADQKGSSSGGGRAWDKTGNEEVDKYIDRRNAALENSGSQIYPLYRKDMAYSYNEMKAIYAAHNNGVEINGKVPDIRDCRAAADQWRSINFVEFAVDNGIFKLAAALADLKKDPAEDPVEADADGGESDGSEDTDGPGIEAADPDGMKEGDVDTAGPPVMDTEPADTSGTGTDPAGADRTDADTAGNDTDPIGAGTGGQGADAADTSGQDTGIPVIQGQHEDGEDATEQDGAATAPDGDGAPARDIFGKKDDGTEESAALGSQAAPRERDEGEREDRQGTGAETEPGLGGVTGTDEAGPVGSAEDIEEAGMAETAADTEEAAGRGIEEGVSQDAGRAASLDAAETASQGAQGAGSQDAERPSALDAEGPAGPDTAGDPPAAGYGGDGGPSMGSADQDGPAQGGADFGAQDTAAADAAPQERREVTSLKEAISEYLAPGDDSGFGFMDILNYPADPENGDATVGDSIFSDSGLSAEDVAGCIAEAIVKNAGGDPDAPDGYGETQEMIGNLIDNFSSVLYDCGDFAEMVDRMAQSQMDSQGVSFDSSGLNAIMDGVLENAPETGAGYLEEDIGDLEAMTEAIAGYVSEDAAKGLKDFAANAEGPLDMEAGAPSGLKAGQDAAFSEGMQGQEGYGPGWDGADTGFADGGMGQYPDGMDAYGDGLDTADGWDMGLDGSGMGQYPDGMDAYGDGLDAGYGTGDPLQGQDGADGYGYGDYYDDPYDQDPVS